MPEANGMQKKNGDPQTLLALSTWVGRTGVSELPVLAELTDWHAWAARVRLDYIELRSYAQAVYAATAEYIGALPDDVLDEPHGELSACVLNALLLNLSIRRGEIVSMQAFSNVGFVIWWLKSIADALDCLH
jgi:hypothetical protein